jgi:hypothetical protein
LTRHRDGLDTMRSVYKSSLEELATFYRNYIHLVMINFSDCRPLANGVDIPPGSEIVKKLPFENLALESEDDARGENEEFSLYSFRRRFPVRITVHESPACDFII